MIDSATPEIYTLSLHDALPISGVGVAALQVAKALGASVVGTSGSAEKLNKLKSLGLDRKSTRLNSSHRCISYAVFCLKKKKKEETYNNIESRDIADEV